MQYGSLLGVTLGVALGLGVPEAWAVSEVKTGMSQPDAPGWSVVTLEPGMAAAVLPTSEAIAPASEPIPDIAIDDPATDWADHDHQRVEPDASAPDGAKLPVAPSEVERPAAIANVTTVEELSDVSSDHWAYRAVQSLVEDYACLEGYPDQTFGSDRALTRYEFAAAVNACLDAVRLFEQEVFRTDGTESIQRLQAEFQEVIYLQITRAVSRRRQGQRQRR